MDVPLLYELYSSILLALSVAACAYVLYISRKIYRRTRMEYPWMLAFHTMVELLYGIAGGVGMTVEHTNATYLYLVSYNSLLASAPMIFVDVIIFLSSFFMSLALPNNVVHFWYRYSMLCKGVTWSPRKYTAIFSVAVLLLLLTYIPYFGFREYENEESRRALDSDKVPRHIYFPLPPKDLDAPNKLHLNFATLETVLSTLICYSSMVFCELKIYRKMKEYSERGLSTTEKTQQRLVLVMVLQGAYPALLFVLPHLILAVFITFGVEIKDITFLVASSIQLLPVLDSLTVLLFIPSYNREAFVRFKSNSTIKQRSSGMWSVTHVPTAKSLASRRLTIPL